MIQAEVDWYKNDVKIEAERSRLADILIIIFYSTVCTQNKLCRCITLCIMLGCNMLFARSSHSLRNTRNMIQQFVFTFDPQCRGAVNDSQKAPLQ